jgi:hypothetical protein
LPQAREGVWIILETCIERLAQPTPTRSVSEGLQENRKSLAHALG